MANTMPYLILGTFLLVRGRPEFFFATALVYLVGGFIIWIVGRDHAIYIGASGVIFGWFGYLTAAVFFERPIRLKSVAITAVVILIYGSVIFGIFPHAGLEHVAWESHLVGFIMGILAAFLAHFVYARYFEGHSKLQRPVSNTTDSHAPLAHGEWDGVADDFLELGTVNSLNDSASEKQPLLSCDACNMFFLSNTEFNIHIASKYHRERADAKTRLTASRESPSLQEQYDDLAKFVGQ